MAAYYSAGVPVLVEGERLRPVLDELLQYADYVVTSAHFPQVQLPLPPLGAFVALAPLVLTQQAALSVPAPLLPTCTTAVQLWLA